MNAFVPYLMALHQQDLLEQAELSRRAKLSERSRPSVPAWRRLVSELFESVARSLNSSAGTVSETPLTTGRGANALPAC
jgi:hypothetical protein